MDFVGVDKSMARFVSEYDNLDYLKPLPNFCTARSAAGFYFGRVPVNKKFHKLKDPWNINTFAGFVGSEVMRDRKYISKTRKHFPGKG